jgi:hypothetical protein
MNDVLFRLGVTQNKQFEEEEDGEEEEIEEEEESETCVKRIMKQTP